jgi:hypothetical protein
MVFNALLRSLRGSNLEIFKVHSLQSYIPLPFRPLSLSHLLPTLNTSLQN